MMLARRSVLNVVNISKRAAGGGRYYNKYEGLSYSNPVLSWDALPAGGVEELKAKKIMGFPVNLHFNTTTVWGKRNLFKAVLTFWTLVFLGMKARKN